MDENPTLSAAVFNAISEWLGNDSLLTGFMLVTSELGSEGVQNIRVCSPDTQPYHTSLGLIGFAEEYVRDDIRTAFVGEWTEE